MTIIGSGSIIVGTGGKALGVPNAPAASAPAAMVADTHFTVTNNGTGGDATLHLAVAPSNNGAAITDYEYRIGAGGSWVSAGLLASDLILSDLFTDGVATDVYCRAVNSAGNGPDGTAKSVTTSVSTSRTQAQVESLFTNGLPNCGVQQSLTKTAGVDSLPAGASISGDVITVTGDDIAFANWDFTGYRLTFNSGSTGCSFTHCLFASDPGHIGWAGQFILRVNAGAVIDSVSWCTFIGSGAYNGEAALVKEQESSINGGAGTTCGKITMFERNALLWPSNDAFKMESNGTVRDNYFGPPRHYSTTPPTWSSGATYNTDDPVLFSVYLFISKVNGNTNHQPPNSKTSDSFWQNLDPHADHANPLMCIGTGKEIYGNYFNRSNTYRLTEDGASAYGHGMNSSFFPVRNANSLNSPMESINFHHNIIAGITAQSYEINLGSAGTTGASLWHPHTVENNWLQPNANGAIYYPGYAAAGHTVQNNVENYTQSAPS